MYPLSEILFSNEDEQNTTRNINMCEYIKHNTERKKPDTKKYICDSIILLILN